jgi:nucleotide-binding universal stress UspA family protein/RimJ/RimL family protein N-acetyltransferase
MASPARGKTVTLRDGTRVRLRPIAPEDKPVLAASFDRLSEESRYRRFFMSKKKLSAAELDYLVDVDHTNHEAIVAVEAASGEGLGVARFVRSTDDPESAEVAVTVADDWQGRGVGRALLERLTYRARREGIRRFSAVVLADNQASVALLEGVGETRRTFAPGEVELVIELPPERGMGIRLTRALRAVATGVLTPARPPVRPELPIQTIVVGTDGSQTEASSLAYAMRLAAALGAELHIVSAYGAFQSASDTEAALATASRVAREEGVEAVTHTRRDDPADALIAVAEEQGAQLVVVGGQGMSGPSRLLLGTVADKVVHHAPCSVLIVRSAS